MNHTDDNKSREVSRRKVFAVSYFKVKDEYVLSLIPHI